MIGVKQDRIFQSDRVYHKRDLNGCPLDIASGLLNVRLENNLLTLLQGKNKVKTSPVTKVATKYAI